MHMYVCMYVCMFVCMYVCLYVCMCVYVRMYVCMYVCMCVYIYIYIYIYIYKTIVDVVIMYYAVTIFYCIGTVVSGSLSLCHGASFADGGWTLIWRVAARINSRGTPTRDDTPAWGWATF